MLVVGSDKVHPRVLKELAEEVSKHLAIMFTNGKWMSHRGLEEGQHIAPFLKKGKEELEDYRLVSLTLMPGKLPEYITRKSIRKHLEKERLMMSS